MAAGLLMSGAVEADLHGEPRRLNLGQRAPVSPKPLSTARPDAPAGQAMPPSPMPLVEPVTRAVLPLSMLPEAMVYPCYIR